MTPTETTLAEITRRLVATYQPEQVVLFGSHAWGEPNENSDVDLLVVVAESNEPAYRRASAGYRSLFGLFGWVCHATFGCVLAKKYCAKHPCPRRSPTRSFPKAGYCMAEPLTSQMWVAAWLQKADPAFGDVTNALQTAQQFHGFVSAKDQQDHAKTDSIALRLNCCR